MVAVTVVIVVRHDRASGGLIRLVARRPEELSLIGVAESQVRIGRMMVVVMMMVIVVMIEMGVVVVVAAVVVAVAVAVVVVCGQKEVSDGAEIR